MKLSFEIWMIAKGWELAYDAMGVVSMLTPTGGVDRGPKAEASVWEMGRVVCLLDSPFACIDYS